MSSAAICVAGSTQRWGTDPLPGEETLLWGVQVPQVQTQVDERQQLGQHGPGVHQVPHHGLPTQTGESQVCDTVPAQDKRWENFCHDLTTNFWVKQYSYLIILKLRV